MKSKFLLGLPLVGCLVFSSCYRIPDKPRTAGLPKEEQTVTSQDQQKIQEQRELMAKEQEEKENEKKQEIVIDADKPVEKRDEEKVEPDKPVEKRGDWVFANPVPGQEGFVFSPYNNKKLDVRGLPSGTLVHDPTYPRSEKKYFRVP